MTVALIRMQVWVASLDVSFSFMMCAFKCVGVCIYVWVGVGILAGRASTHSGGGIEAWPIRPEVGLPTLQHKHTWCSNIDRLVPWYVLVCGVKLRVFCFS